MITKVFKIKCLTNMHVGNGDVNFNVIDNEVERDASTGYPTINSSGVKGALREYLVAQEYASLNEAFGKDGDNGQGRIKFLSANMLAIPMRVSKGDSPYCLVTTKKAVEHFNELNKALHTGLEINVDESTTDTVCVEDNVCKLATGFEDYTGEKAVVMEEKSFKSVSLPVVARNRLENGKSANLWYEEVVPHEAVFTFALIANDGDKELLCDLTKEINNKVIQFGGNASIGYGLCEVSLIQGGCENE